MLVVFIFKEMDLFMEVYFVSDCICFNSLSSFIFNVKFPLKIESNCLKSINMIPKIIHYCWLSKDPIPKDMQMFIDGWYEKLPDYEFMLWDFNRFDIHSSQWVKEAFSKKKYAFAADYIRLYALYNYGGIYMDMDVEVLKSFDPFLKLKTMICFENSKQGLEMATFGVEKELRG